MQILCADLGHFSVKFFVGKIDQGQVLPLEVSEKKLPDYSPENFLEQALSLVQNFIQEYHFQGKLVLCLPQSLILTRFFTIPVTGKRKVEQMLPFQLEGGLPFSLNEVHYSFCLFKKQQESFVQASSLENQIFFNFNESLKQFSLSPSVISCPSHFWSGALQKVEETAILLDLGFQGVNAFHLAGGQISLVNSFFTGAKSLEIFLGKEAQEISFTDQDLPQLKQFFFPLVREMRRWMISHQVKFKSKKPNLYLTGGMSCLEGIAPFLSEVLELPITKLPEQVFSFPLPQKGNQQVYGLCYSMMEAHVIKAPVANLLTGRYRMGSKQTVTIESFSFIFTRTLSLSIIGVLLLLIENNAFLGPELKSLERQSRGVIKNPDSGVDKKMQRKLRSSPEVVLKSIETTTEALKKDYLRLKEVEGDPLIKNLFKISEAVGNNDHVTLKKVHLSKTGLEASLEALDSKEAQKLGDYLKSLGFSHFSLEQVDKTLNLKLVN